MIPWAMGVTLWVMSSLFLAFLLAPRMNHDTTPTQNEDES